MSKVENLVIKNLLLDEEYVRKAMPFIKAEYFSDVLEKNIYNVINKYFTDYSALPTKEALEIEVGQLGNISDEQHRQTIQYIRDIDDEKSEYDWILDTTENGVRNVLFTLHLWSQLR